jgi:hypothetical protein
MPVFDAHPGIKVQILCNGAPLQECEDDRKSTVPNSVTKYVEAISGVAICIRGWALLTYKQVEAGAKTQTNQDALLKNLKNRWCNYGDKGATGLQILCSKTSHNPSGLRLHVSMVKTWVNHSDFLR